MIVRQSMNLQRGHVRIFVADLEDHYNTRLYRQLADLKPDDPGNINTALSNPIGELLDFSKPEGHRQHYYYAQEVWVHQQLLQSPLRVHNLEEADIVYLPFYLGAAQKLVITYEHDQTVRLLQEFWNGYSRSDSFKSGKPHWISLADIELLYQSGCGGWGLNILCRNEHRLPANLVITTAEIFYGTHSERAQDFSSFHKNPSRTIESVMVPYMGHVHLSRGSLRLQQSFNETEVLATKQHLAVQSFWDKTSLRKQLKAECLDSTSPEARCLHFEPESGVRTEFDQDRIQKATAKAWFCPQPAGDTPTRAATFDCLMAGALPVFFDPLMIDMLPFGDKIPWQDISVVLPEVQRDGGTMLDKLDRIPVADRMSALEQLHKAQPMLQYSLNPDHWQVRFSSRDDQSSLDDAFTSMIKAVLQFLCKKGKLKRRCQLRRDLEQSDG